MHSLIFYLLAPAFLLLSNSPPSLPRVVSNNGTVDIKELDTELDQLIRDLFGDFDLTQEGLWQPRFPNHVGDDNAIHYANEWLVHVPEGLAQAEKLANETGYKNLGQLRGFPDIFQFTKIEHAEKHHRGARELTEELVSDNRVTWADQQYAKLRTKREFDIMKMLQGLDISNFIHVHDVQDNGARKLNFNDPLWYKEWYMQDTRTKASLPRLDLNVVPVFNMGITGKGIKVVILDDGLEHNHTDLIDNYNPKISGDLNDNDDDPMPHYQGKVANSHGTRCAGEVAMIANNSKCGVGVAYQSQIGGVRMLDGPVTDRIEGEALSFASAEVDIYSSSWGPSDDGETVEGPGRLAQRAFLQGVTKGRGGKGIIFVWASGNGGAKGDSCSCDGYASNVHTLSIGSASESGSFPWYGEMCPSTMAVTYSSGAYTDQKIATTDILNTCTTSHTGTSASAPLAAGIIALTLQANPALTWRDVKHLVAWTSQPGPLYDNPGWRINHAGLEFNSRFGFGLMDAHGMVVHAKNWTNVPPMKICRIQALPLSDKRMNGKSPKLAQFVSGGCRGTKNEINFLEHVELLTSVQYSTRGALQIDLTSPQGTNTRVLFPRKNDASPAGFSAWPFVSVHNWGENPAGTWTVTFSDAGSNPKNNGFLEGLELILYGTATPPLHYKSGPRVYPRVYKRELLEEQEEDTQDTVELHRLKAILNDFPIQEWV